MSPWPMAATSSASPASGLTARTYLDAGAFGCLGVGVPFAIAAKPGLPRAGR
jgi:thiamine pyrophosphate-dependent acetolactate synthase large subunit-like protein